MLCLFNNWCNNCNRYILNSRRCNDALFEYTRLELFHLFFFFVSLFHDLFLRCVCISLLYFSLCMCILIILFSFHLFLFCYVWRLKLKNLIQLTISMMICLLIIITNLSLSIALCNRAVHAYLLLLVNGFMSFFEISNFTFFCRTTLQYIIFFCNFFLFGFLYTPLNVNCELIENKTK